MYWLAEQGLAPKRVFLVVALLIIFFSMGHIKRVLAKKGDKDMVKIKNTFDTLIVNLDCFISLSGNVTGGALLANMF